MFAPVPEKINDFQQPITSSYFTERPQMIWVGFQTVDAVDQTANYALYKHANVESMYIQMNNTQFPPNIIKADWGENNSGFFYEAQKHLRANYLQYPARYTEGNMLDPIKFRDLYTIYCFDVSKQEMTLGSNNITCSLHVFFKSQTGDNLRVYIYHGSMIVLSSCSLTVVRSTLEGRLTITSRVVRIIIDHYG